MLRKQKFSELHEGKQKKHMGGRTGKLGKKDQFVFNDESSEHEDDLDYAEVSGEDSDGVFEKDTSGTPLFGEPPSKMDRVRETASSVSGAISSFCGSLFKSRKKDQPYGGLQQEITAEDKKGLGIESFADGTTDPDSSEEEKGGCLPWLRRR